MTPRRISKEIRHDALVDVIEEELQWRGYHSSEINKDWSYNNDKGCGQIDLAVLTEKYVILFEMKCTYSARTMKKANSQMNRAIKCLNLDKHRRVFKMYTYYDKNQEDGFNYKWIRG